MQGLHPGVEVRGGRQARRDGVVAHAFDHGDEGLAGEPFDPRGPARIGIDEAWRHLHASRTGRLQQGVQRAPDERVATGSRLQLHLAVDRMARGGVLRVEHHRTVVAFDGGQRAAGFDQAQQVAQRAGGVGQVFEHEAHEHVVERGGGKG